MTRTTHYSAFTLIELVLVLVILATAVAVVAPKFTGWRLAQQLRNASDKFLGDTRWAHTQAIANGTVYRVIIADDGQSYQVKRQEGQNFVETQSSRGRATNLPDGTHMQILPDSNGNVGATDSTGGNASVKAIDFLPSGRTQPAKIRFTSDQGDQIDIECPSPAEGFMVMQSTGGVQ
jgi:type II secretion system protein H